MPQLTLLVDPPAPYVVTRQPAPIRRWELVSREVCSGCSQSLAEDVAEMWLVAALGVRGAAAEVNRAHDAGKCLACWHNPE
jgi:hypothetical protein